MVSCEMVASVGADLEHVGREEWEKDDDEGEHQAHVLHAATPDTVLSIKLIISYQDQVV